VSASALTRSAALHLALLLALCACRGGAGEEREAALDPLGALGAQALEGGEGDPVTLERFDARAMGTTYSFTLPRRAAGREAAGRAAALALGEVTRVERRLSTWIDTSELERLNRAEGRPTPLSEETCWLLLESKRVTALTRGAFDVTWAALKGLWDLKAGVVPAHDEVRRRLALVGAKRLHVTPAARPRDPLALAPPPGRSPRGEALGALLGALPPRPLWLSALPAGHGLWAELGARTTEAEGCVARLEPGARVDLGGIGKGYAIGSAARLLRRLGFEGFLVDGGGDLQVEGRAPGGAAWVVGIQHPRAEGLWASLEAPAGWSVATSGDYERFFEVDGARYHHILDLRVGYPAQGVASITVLARDATLADALATGLFVLGPVEGLEVAEGLEGVEALWLVAGGAVVRTSGFERLSGPLPPRWLPPAPP